MIRPLQMATDGRTGAKNKILAICGLLSSLLRVCVGKKPQMANDLVPVAHRWQNSHELGTLATTSRRARLLARQIAKVLGVSDQTIDNDLRDPAKKLALAAKVPMKAADYESVDAKNLAPTPPLGGAEAARLVTEASQRKIAKVLGVNNATVNRDAHDGVANATVNPPEGSETADVKGVGVANATPSLGGAEAARLVTEASQRKIAKVLSAAEGTIRNDLKPTTAQNYAPAARDP